MRSSRSPRGLPRWLGAANRVVMFLNRLGVTVGTQHVLTLRGRVSGLPRSTPVSLLSVDGHRYIVSTGPATDWVKNARVARRGSLTRGRATELVGLAEVPTDGRAPILREFPRQVPGGMSFLEGVLGGPLDADALVEAAPRIPIFRVDRD